MGERIQFKPTEQTSPEHAFAIIQKAIQTRRDQFVAEYQAGKHGSVALTYEQKLDRAVYKKLGEFEGSNTEAFQKAKQQLDDYTTFQLQTFLGERLNVGLSRYEFDIREGLLYGQQMDESLVAMIDRGRNARNALSSPVDQLRQDAEVIQFQKIEKLLADSHTKPGTTMISVSPPGSEGSSYIHNFYDVFILKEKPDGKRYVEARRYASALDPEESLEKAKTLQPGYGADRGETPLDTYFLSHPLVIKNSLHMLYNNPDGIHSFMHENYNSMTEQDFALVKDVTAGIISIYLQEVYAHPDDITGHAKILDALMNKADYAAAHLDGIREQKAQQYTLRRGIAFHEEERVKAIGVAMADILHFGNQPVREITTGCGVSGGFSKNTIGGIAIDGGTRMAGNLSPLSLFDKQKQEWFTCPECGWHATGPIGENGACGGCGLTKDKYKGPKCA